MTTGTRATTDRTAIVTVDLDGVFSWECTAHETTWHGAQSFDRALAEFNARIHDVHHHWRSS